MSLCCAGKQMVTAASLIALRFNMGSFLRAVFILGAALLLAFPPKLDLELSAAAVSWILEVNEHISGKLGLPGLGTFNATAEPAKLADLRQVHDPPCFPEDLI